MNWNSELNKKRTKREIMEGVECEKAHIVANNTIEYWSNGNRVIRLHLTDIITFHPDGSFILNSGGWRTMTTKGRINSFSPVNVYSEKGVWYVANTVFYDGMHLDESGQLLSEAILDPTQENAKIKRKIAKFVKQIDSLDEMPKPDNGDCWGCLMVAKDGSHPMGTDCIQGHLDENYLHGSLIIRALKANHYKQDQLPYVFNAKWAVKNSLRKLLTKELVPDIAV